MRVSPRVGHRIARDFADGDRPHVVDALSSLDLGFGNHDSDERISVAILVLAEGSVSRLRDAVRLAVHDWRDLLVAAGLENEDWRERVAEALEDLAAAPEAANAVKTQVALKWPDGWQPEAIQAALPYVGGEERLDILVGDPVRSHSGTRLSGHLYRGEDDRVMVIYDRSGRSDVYPWALLGGPVLVIKLLRPRRRALELYRHPQWTAR